MQDQHLPQLDGVRGLALLIVLLGHLITRDIGFGITKLGPLPPSGVDLFFVLSGFLITNVLLRARGHDNFFRNFYARRALRIAPLYYALLIFMFAIANHRLAALTFNDQNLHWQVYALYLQNLYYRKPSQLGPLTLAITWSLAIEEQFYMVWPFLVSRLKIRNMVAVASSLVIIAPIARVIVPTFGWDSYTNPLCRMDAMAIGALLSLWFFHAKPSETRIKTQAGRLLVVAAAGEIVCHFLGLTHIMSKSFVALMFASLLALSLTIEPLGKLLSTTPLRLTGKLSYCLYLTHPIVGVLVYHRMGGSSMAMRTGRSLLTLALCYAVALFSWHFFESPILGLKRYFVNQRSPTGRASLDKLYPSPLDPTPAAD